MGAAPVGELKVGPKNAPQCPARRLHATELVRREGRTVAERVLHRVEHGLVHRARHQERPDRHVPPRAVPGQTHPRTSRLMNRPPGAALPAGADLLGRSPERHGLLGLVPETLDLSLERSAAVEREMPARVERIVEEARAWGYELVRKGADEAPSLGRRRLAPVAAGL